MKKTFKTLLIIITATLILTGCSSKKIKVGYTVYPVQYLLEKIGGEKVEAITFSNKRMVTRSQLADNYKEVLDQVDTLFIMGELEPYMDIINQDIIDANTDIIDLSLKSGVFNFERQTRVNVDNQVVNVTSIYYDNPIFDSVDKYNVDPYLWLDPITMTSMANQVRNYLVETDPDSTVFYNKNFNELKVELAHLDANFLDLRKGESFSFATMTPSYGIWENNYNYSISPIILSKYGVLPSKQQLELIKVRLVNDGVNYLIVEETLDADVLKLAEELAADLNLEKVFISNLAFRSNREIEANMDYIQIMNANLTVLEKLNTAVQDLKKAASADNE